MSVAVREQGQWKRGRESFSARGLSRLSSRRPKTTPDPLAVGSRCQPAIAWRRGLFLALIAASWSSALGQVVEVEEPAQVMGQVIEVQDQPAAVIQDDVVLQVDPDEQPQNGQVQVAFEMPEQVFDQWVFQGNGTAASGRTKLDNHLKLRLEDIDRACRLTPAQKNKLQLAGRGDVKRLFDRLEEIRAKFMELRKDQNKIGQVFQDIQPLQTAFNSGAFGDGSFFRKSLKHTLDQEQFAKYEKEEAQRAQFHYHAKISLVVTMLEGGMPLRDEQRQQLIKLMQEKTTPPKKYGQYDYYVVLHKMWKLPEASLKSILTPSQWKTLNTQFNQARGMEQFLKTGGFIP